MKLVLNWKILFCSLAIIGVFTTSLGYIVGVSSVTMTTGIKVWKVVKENPVYCNSIGYYTVPGMKLTIDAPVSTNLVITFLASCYAYPGEALFVQVYVDGVAVSPKEVQWVANGAGGVRSFTWVKHVTKGTHTIRVKWANDMFAVTGAFAQDRSLVVLANSYKTFT